MIQDEHQKPVDTENQFLQFQSPMANVNVSAPTADTSPFTSSTVTVPQPLDLNCSPYKAFHTLQN